MKISLYRCFFSLALFLIPSSSSASFAQLEQTAFNKRLKPDGSMQFAYQWRLDEKRYNLQFTLDQDQVLSLPLTAPNFSNQMLNREVEVALKRHAVALSQRGVQATVRKLPREISYSVTAPNQTTADIAIEELEAVSHEAKQKYYERHYVVNFTDHLNRDFVQNDYVQYASKSIEGLKPIVEAIKDIQENASDSREFTKLAMTWLQSIPYNDLLNRNDSNGAGFLSPIDLLRRNVGDCDSKSTLLAALLKAYDHNLRIHMVLLPQHALLAMSLPAQNDEQTLNINGRDMLLIEPTGPAHFGKGQVDGKSALAILNRQYETLTF
ncbi:MAG: hypothetical protein AAGJ37_15725 [Pseudomonadota bacterium]